VVWAVGRPEVCCTQEPLKFDPGEVFDEAWSLMEKEFFDQGFVTSTGKSGGSRNARSKTLPELIRSLSWR